MSKRQVECLERLSTLQGSMEEIVQFLANEKLFSIEEIKEYKSSSFKAKYLQLKIQDLNSKEKFQLLEYEWTILPVERIKITIVTDRNSKEFTWNV